MSTENNVYEVSQIEKGGEGLGGLPTKNSGGVEKEGVVETVANINTGVADKASKASDTAEGDGRMDLKDIEVSFFKALASKNKDGMGAYAGPLLNMLSRDPNDREAYCKFARFRFMHGASVLNGLKKGNPRFAEQNKRLAEELLGEAKRYANIALGLEGDESEPLALLGGVAFAEREFEQSRGYMEKVIAIKPEDFDAHATLASIYKADTFKSEGNQQRVNMAKAIEHFELHIRHLWNALNEVNPAVKIADSAVDAHWRKLKKSLEAAIAFCDRVESYYDMTKFGLSMAEMLPDNKGKVLDVADLLIKKGEFVGARKLAVELMLGGEEEGWIYQQAEGFLKYIEIIEESANRSAAETMEFLINKVHAAMERLDYEEAAVVAQRFIQDFPRDPKGEILVKDVDIEACGDTEALRQMEEVLTDDYEASESADIGYLLAKVLVKRNKYTEARELLKEVIEANFLPDDIADAPRELVALWFVVSPLEADDEIFQALLVSGADLLALNAVQANLKERLFRDKGLRSGFKNNKFWGQNWKKGAKNLTGYR